MALSKIPSELLEGAVSFDASAPADSLVIDSSGNVGIGTSSPVSKLNVNGGSVTLAETTAGTYNIDFQSRTASTNARIQYDQVTNTTGQLLFYTNGGSLAERARIDSSGGLLVGKTGNGSTGQGSVLFPNASWQSSVNGTASAYHALFYRNADTTPLAVGSITSSGSTTSYTTSSDYRLKENVVGVTGAAARVQQLNPVRFNFIADPDKTVDGFLAHEVQDVVPEAITGTKDAVETYTDDEGNEQTRPVYQGIDQSKLVPLLTAALQEALTEITSLKARVAALEAA